MNRLKAEQLWGGRGLKLMLPQIEISARDTAGLPGPQGGAALWGWRHLHGPSEALVFLLPETRWDSFSLFPNLREVWNPGHMKWPETARNELSWPLEEGH